MIFLLAPLFLPKALAPNLAWIPDDARLNAINILGGEGSGKSRLMGRLLAFFDFLRGIPVVIMDPTGTTVENFLDKLCRLPQPRQESLWPRVLYVDMSGQTEQIVPFPLYYRLSPEESLETIAQRYLEVIRRLDPSLERASVEGWNALVQLGTDVGMILAALGFQITEAADLIHHPHQWKERLAQAIAAYPEVRPAVENLLRFAKEKPEYRTRRSDSFLTKSRLFLRDPRMQAMFGAATPGIDWAQVIANRTAVLLDFRHELTQERKRFKLLWVFLGLLTFFKYRGPAGRSQPISFIFDEITQILNIRTPDGHSILADDFEELVSVVGRNYGVWGTYACQSLTQLDLRIRTTLLRRGSQIIGVTPDPEDAFYLARQLVPYDPFVVKKQEKVWGSMPQFDQYRFPLMYSLPEVVDYKDVEYTPEEFYLLAMQRFQKLQKFQFLAKLGTGEGNISGPLQDMTIARVDAGIYPDPTFLNHVRGLLTQRHGRPQAAILAEIQNRLRPTEAPGILREDHVPPPISAHHHFPATTSTEPEADSSTPSADEPVSTGKEDDGFWE
jgi:hypothetical protein